MWFTTVILRNIRRRPLRSFLTLISVAMAVCAVDSLVGVSNGFKATFLNYYEGIGIDLLVVRSGSARRLTSTMDESLATEIEKIDGVMEVIPGLVDVVSFPEYNLDLVPISGLTPETRVFDYMEVKSGRMLKNSDHRGVMLGVTLAENLGKKAGEKLEIIEGDEPFEIVGVYDGFNVIQNGSMVVSVKDLQTLMGREGQISGISIRVTESDDKELLATVARKIEKLENGIAVRPTREHVESLQEIKTAIAMAWVTSTIATIIGAIGMLNTMFMSVQERTLEIGILRAVGWSRMRVVGMILYEAIVLSIIGAVVGTVVAIVLVRILTLMPAVNGLIEGDISPVVIAQGFAIALVVGFIGGLLPAITASRLSPNEALRR